MDEKTKKYVAGGVVLLALFSVSYWHVSTTPVAWYEQGTLKTSTVGEFVTGDERDQLASASAFVWNYVGGMERVKALGEARYKSMSGEVVKCLVEIANDNESAKLKADAAARGCMVIMKFPSL